MHMYQTRLGENPQPYINNFVIRHDKPTLPIQTTPFKHFLKTYNYYNYATKPKTLSASNIVTVGKADLNCRPISTKFKLSKFTILNNQHEKAVKFVYNKKLTTKEKQNNGHQPNQSYYEDERFYSSLRTPPCSRVSAERNISPIQTVVAPSNVFENKSFDLPGMTAQTPTQYLSTLSPDLNTYSQISEKEYSRFSTPTPQKESNKGQCYSSFGVFSQKNNYMHSSSYQNMSLIPKEEELAQREKMIQSIVLELEDKEPPFYPALRLECRNKEKVLGDKKFIQTNPEPGTFHGQTVNIEVPNISVHNSTNSSVVRVESDVIVSISDSYTSEEGEGYFDDDDDTVSEIAKEDSFCHTSVDVHVEML